MSSKYVCISVYLPSPFLWEVRYGAAAAQPNPVGAPGVPQQWRLCKIYAPRVMIERSGRRVNCPALQWPHRAETGAAIPGEIGCEVTQKVEFQPPRCDRVLSLKSSRNLKETAKIWSIIFPIFPVLPTVELCGTVVITVIVKWFSRRQFCSHSPPGLPWQLASPANIAAGMLAWPGNKYSIFHWKFPIRYRWCCWANEMLKSSIWL